MRKLTTQQFIDKANYIHNNKYNYSKINYINTKTKVIIICKTHGKFKQVPYGHLSKQGCPKCNHSNKINKNIFIKRANKKHNNKYDYSKINYINTKIKVIIICKIHGKFSQIPSNHLNGNGCIKCSIRKRTLTLNQFIKKANKIHNNKYDYSKVNYINSKIKVIIICPKHGEFYQTPDTHLNNHGCSNCTCRISKSSQSWLNKIEKENNIKLEREKIIWINNKYIFTDGFNSKTNTCYEYNGNYWHGNPKIYDQNKIHPVAKVTYGKLYQKTLNKEQLIKSAGYNLITKWGN